MSQAYTPTLEVTEKTTVSKLRELPLLGKAIVRVGDKVNADTTVLTAELPGELPVLHVSERMGLEPIDVIEGMKVKVGDQIKPNDLICETKSFFGMFTHQLKSPIEGTVEFFTEINAHLGVRKDSIPLTVNAYISGEVKSIEEGKSVTIETDATLIQGIFGVGGERQGIIQVLSIPNDQVVTVETLKAVETDLTNVILFGGAQFDISALNYAAEKKVAGVVTGSIDAITLRDFVGFEIGVSITGDEEVPFTLIITEGFGKLSISKRIIEVAKKRNAEHASINGATQVRAGAMRPEVIIPITNQTVGDTTINQKSLDVGASIRLIRVPYFGEFGKVTELPTQPVIIESGAKVRVLKAKLNDGREVVVPRANVELV